MKTFQLNLLKIEVVKTSENGKFFIIFNVFQEDRQPSKLGFEYNFEAIRDLYFETISMDRAIEIIDRFLVHENLALT
jgi:hypothetical protein